MSILEIDGSFGEGGGQILRTAVSLSCITEKPIEIKNIRQKRKNPGLKAQHLLSIKMLAQISNAHVEGLSIGSTSLKFSPGKMQSMSISENVGTAGSIPLILQALIPAVSLSGTSLRLDIRGGTDVPWSPTSNYTKFVLGQAYAKMGIDFTMNVKKRGYYPKGGGQIQVTVNPCATVNPIRLSERKEKEAKLFSSCTDLNDKVRESINHTVNKIKENGFTVETENVQEKALNSGGSMLIMSSEPQSIIGSDELLDFRNPQNFGKRAASSFLETNLGADVNLSDMLVMPLSLCKEMSSFSVGRITKHLETNLYITSKITGCKYGIGKIDGGYEVRIQGA